LNNELVLDWARSLAGRVFNDSGLTLAAQVDRAFRFAYGRAASAEEQKVADDFLAKQIPIMAARLAGNDPKPPLPANLPPGTDPARAAAIVDLCHMLLDSNEFLYIN
jgi:hypothetical protein